MSTPIKETPFLKGNDAEMFHNAVKENVGKAVSKKEAKRISENYETLNRKLNQPK
jgi:hypothetical protein